MGGFLLTLQQTVRYTIPLGREVSSTPLLAAEQYKRGKSDLQHSPLPCIKSVITAAKIAAVRNTSDLCTKSFGEKFDISNI